MAASKPTPHVSRRLLLLTPLLTPLPALAAESLVDGQGTERILPLTSDNVLSTAARQILEYNRRVQRQNNAPQDFPNFVREGFDMTLLADDGYRKLPNGLLVKDYIEGTGPMPVDGQEVLFDYTAFNESGSKIDSSFRQGRPGQTRLGINGLIPGFELGIKGMKRGGKRRIIVPPSLGPPVGPSTFFSAKQYEVFDVELITIRNCVRRQFGFTSDVVCEDIGNVVEGGGGDVVSADAAPSTNTPPTITNEGAMVDAIM